MNENIVIKTKYKSFEEYCVVKKKITFKTFAVNLKDSDTNLTRIIGRGCFALVYKTFFQIEYYAIKKLSNEHYAKYGNCELEKLKHLTSNCIVKLYDYWIKSENDLKFLYIQMELCDQTLKDIIEIEE